MSSALGKPFRWMACRAHFLRVLPLARLFGAGGQVLNEICRHILPFSWGFVFAGANSIVSSYLYSTMHSKQAIVLNVVRSFLTNTFSILVLPLIFGEGIIWYTYGISEILVSILAALLLRSLGTVGK